jgi:hypothetical protein
LLFGKVNVINSKVLYLHTNPQNILPKDSNMFVSGAAISTSIFIQHPDVRSENLSLTQNDFIFSMMQKNNNRIFCHHRFCWVILRSVGAPTECEC